MPDITCEWCPHGLVLLRSGTYWCPCEDCHPGGRIQGRKYPDTVTQVASTGAANFDAAVQRAFEGTGVEVRTSFTESEPDDEDVWVDPVHSV